MGLCGFYFLFLLFDIEIGNILWLIRRPYIYYVEISDHRHGDVYYTSAIVKGDEILYPTKKGREGNTWSINHREDLMIFTINQLFSLAKDGCPALAFKCDILFNKEFFYIEDISVFDWRGVFVDEFVSCESIEYCLKVHAEHQRNP